MNAVWGMGQMMFTKFVVVVDEHVDVHDYSEVAWRVFNNVDPERDMIIVDGPARRARPLEPVGRATAPRWASTPPRPWPDEGHGREWPDELAMDPAVTARVDERWAELGLSFR